MWGKRLIQLMIVLLITLLGLLNLIFQTHGIILKIEVLIFLGLLFLTLVSILGLFIEERWSFTVSLLLFTVVLINILYLRTVVHSHPLTFGGVTVFALLGLIWSVALSGKDPMPVIPKYQAPPEAYDIKPLETYSAKTAPKKKTSKRKKKAKKKKSRK